jgi:hypothetical protein
MAIAFSRTMRSLDADDFRGPRVVWLVAGILLAAWTWWFFTAQIPIRDGSQGPGEGVRRSTPAKLAWRAMRLTPVSNISGDSHQQ